MSIRRIAPSVNRRNPTVGSKDDKSSPTDEGAATAGAQSYRSSRRVMPTCPKSVTMARRPTSSNDTGEGPNLDEEEEEEEEEEAPRRTRSRAAVRHPHRGRPRPIRKWSRDATAQDDEMEPEDDGEPRARGRRPRVYWRARDSLYFAPLVALAIVILMVVAMYAFTENWPPVYVVESGSMQHGSSDVLGIINTGDMVLAQKVSNSSIRPYVVAQPTGYTTYGEYGDVLLYYPNGAIGTPVIHRAIIYLQWVSSARAYDAFGLDGHCGTQWGMLYATPGTIGSCATTNLTTTLDLYHIGWADVNVTIELNPTFLGAHSGFITMGDNNINAGLGIYDQSSGFELSQLVEPAWVIGVARGMIPWVGALKLWIEGSPTAGEVPPQSWQFLGLTFAGVILLAFGLHYALRAEGIEDPRRKAEEEAEDEDEVEEVEGSAARARLFLRSLRPWGVSAGESDDEEEEEPPRAVRRHSMKPVPRATVHLRRGRPKPKVRRSAKPKRPAKEDRDF